MHTIQAAFKFSDSDLMANRQGQATEEQVRRLGQGYGCGFALAGVVALAMIVSACAIGFAAAISWFVFDQSAGSGGVAALAQSAAGMLLPLALGVGLLVFLTLSIIRIRRDRREQRVARCSGLFHIESRFMETDSLWKTLHVNQLRFKIDPFQSRALRPYQGQPITVYYFPHSRTIASVEVVGGKMTG
jgi:hypothetical protein